MVKRSKRNREKWIAAGAIGIGAVAVAAYVYGQPPQDTDVLPEASLSITVT